jgi:prolyl oligopeptidase
VRLPIPEDASFQAILHDRAIFSLRSDWNRRASRTSRARCSRARLDDLLQGKNDYKVIFEPTPRTSLDGVGHDQDHLLYMTLDNVRGRLTAWRSRTASSSAKRWRSPAKDRWVAATNDDSDTFFYTYTDFLTPSSLYMADNGKVDMVKSLPAISTPRDDRRAVRSAVEGRHDDSVLRRHAEGVQGRRQGATLLYAYGGFEAAQNPFYSGVMGNSWLARGRRVRARQHPRRRRVRPGLAPRGDQAEPDQDPRGLRRVAEDSDQEEDHVQRAPRHRGRQQRRPARRTAFTLRPDLFKAVVCQVPLLDMYRYSQLSRALRGWTNTATPPRPEDWAYMKTWSPYQLVSKDKEYPAVFFWTTTRDDRVHPGHARKMVAKMADQGHPVMYFENIEGGHGSGSVSTQKATDLRSRVQLSLEDVKIRARAARPSSGRVTTGPLNAS